MTTIAQLLDPSQAPEYPLIRLEAARRLKPGPWKHKYHYAEECANCGTRCWDRLKNIALPALKTPCQKPDPDTRPLPVIVHDLLRKVLAGDLIQTITQCHDMTTVDPKFGELNLDQRRVVCLMWFVFATPAEQAAILLMALEGGEG